MAFHDNFDQQSALKEELNKKVSHRRGLSSF